MGKHSRPWYREGGDALRNHRKQGGMQGNKGDNDKKQPLKMWRNISGLDQDPFATVNEIRKRANTGRENEATARGARQPTRRLTHRNVSDGRRFRSQQRHEKYIGLPKPAESHQQTFFKSQEHNDNLEDKAPRSWKEQARLRSEQKEACKCSIM